MNRFQFALMISIYSIFFACSVSAGNKDKPEKILTETIAVDCNGGDRISDALTSTAVELTIEISGICAEDVKIQRSMVTLLGSDPEFDGISPAPDEFPTEPGDQDFSRALEVLGVSNVTIENLSLKGGRFGLGVNYSFGVDVRNSIIDDHVFGVIIGSASGSNTFENTTITNSNVVGSVGIFVTNGSSLNCINCTVSNYKLGISLRQGSSISISSSTVHMARRAVFVQSGSQIRSSLPNFFEGNTLPGFSSSKGAIRLEGSSVASLGSDTLSGRVEVVQHSIATLSGTNQSTSAFDNVITGGSSLVAAGATVLNGDFYSSEFSNVTLSGGSNVSGVLECSKGADAYCEDPSLVNGGSGSASCGQCQ